MIRISFLLLILIHALIHLMGFLKAFQWAGIEQLTFPIPRMVGVFWLLTFLLFITSAVAYLMESHWWWIVAGIAVIISQILVIMYWQDAKFGTIMNLIIFTGCLLGYGSWDFSRMVENELSHFNSEISKEVEIATVKEAEALPPVVYRWLTHVNAVGKEKIQTAYFEQIGQMKTSPDGSWMPVEAKQYVKTANPGFVWIADVEAAPYIHLAGRDKYEDGKGHMLIKLLSLFPVADAKGEKIDQGTLLRYMAEMVWYPSAALEDYISWEQLDDTSARATMNYGEISASGIFGFNEIGEVVRYEAERYYDRKQGATLETWVIAIDERSYRMIDGIRVPTSAEVTWKLREGDFTWYKLEISDLTFNSKS